MRNLRMALALAGLCALAAARPAAAATVTADDIRRTADVLLREGAGSAADAHDAVRHLLEIAADLGREARLPAPVLAKLDAASAQASQVSPLDAEVRSAAAEAYAALNQGRPFAFPEAVKTIEQAKAHGRRQVDRSLEALSFARKQEAARTILELALLVMTPMHARP